MPNQSKGKYHPKNRAFSNPNLSKHSLCQHFQAYLCQVSNCS